MTGGRVAAVKLELSLEKSQEVDDAIGKRLFSCFVESHVHLTPLFYSSGLRILTLNGVICALDCGGPIEEALISMA